MTQVEQDFAEAWKWFPRKEKKIASFDAYRWAMQNHNQDGTLPARILATLRWQVEVHPEWRFWTTFDKWCLAQRWTDEPPQKPMSQFDRERHERHQKAIAQQMEWARRRQA